MAPSITDRTISACNGLQISSIPKEWADHAWNSDFLESQGFPEVLESSIFDCGCFVRELQELLVISRLWSTEEGQGSLNEGNLTFLIIWITELGAFDLRLTILCIVKRENLEGESNNRSTFIKLLSIATKSSLSFIHLQNLYICRMKGISSGGAFLKVYLNPIMILQL